MGLPLRFVNNTRKVGVPDCFRLNRDFGHLHSILARLSANILMGRICNRSSDLGRGMHKTAAPFKPEINEEVSDLDFCEDIDFDAFLWTLEKVLFPAVSRRHVCRIALHLRRCSRERFDSPAHSASKRVGTLRLSI